MENDEEYFINNLWEKYDKLQKNLDENNEVYQILQKYIENINAEIQKHEISLKLKQSEINLKKGNKLIELFSLFEKSYFNSLNNHKKFIKTIFDNLSKYMAKAKEIKPIYNDFKQIAQNFKLEIIKYKEFRAKYHESALEVETTTLEKIKNYEAVDISRKLKEKVEINLNKYQSCLNELNKILEEYNTKQTNLIKNYVEMEKDDLNIYYSTINNFVKFERDKIVGFLCSDKINQLIMKNAQKDIKLELKKIFKRKKNDKNRRPIKLLKFEEHKSKIDFNSCIGNEEFNNYLDAIDVIKNKYFVKFEVNVDEEKKKNNFRELLKKFFELDSQNSELSEESINQYYDYLNKIPSTHIIFIKILSKLRTKCSFKRNKTLIDILGKSVQIMLEESEKKNDYWMVKNCIILSQTFYYEEEDDINKNVTKKYIFEYIRNNEWLVKKDFWVGYCSWLIEEELLKIVEMFKIELNDIKNNKTFPKKINSKISDVLFSQLLPSLTNILEITNNKTYAVEIIYFFQEKYIYLTKENAESLFNIVSQDTEEVQKLRKEYELKKEQKEKKNVSLNKIETNETMNKSGSDIDFNSSNNLTDIIRDKNSNSSMPILNGEENINFDLIIDEGKETNEDGIPNKNIPENPYKEEKEKENKNSININKTDNLNKIEDKTNNVFDDYEDIKMEDLDDYYDIKNSLTSFQIFQRKIKQKFHKK
jgi:hypothetical protein